MKRVIYAAVITMLAAGSLWTRAYAGDKGKNSQTPSVESRAAQWQEHLGLSPEQSEKLQAAFKAEKDAMRPLRRELRDALAQLKDRVEDKAVDKDIVSALDRLEAAHKAIRIEEEKSQAQLATLLPPMARAKMALQRAKHMRSKGSWKPHMERPHGDKYRPAASQPEEKSENQEN